MQTTQSPKAGERTQELQDGARLISVRKTTGTWVEMEYDARGEYFGIIWLRVKDGMGGRGDREDWVADIPGVSIAVHDYHWNGEEFGSNHGSFLGAIKAETQRALDYANRKLAELQQKTANMSGGIALIQASISKF